MGRDGIAQGNALGHGHTLFQPPWRGGMGAPVIPPLQGGNRGEWRTQGVALGYCLGPLRGRGRVAGGWSTCGNVVWERRVCDRSARVG